MEIFQYSALQDNYNWIIFCKKTGFCAGVDIFDTKKFFEFVTKNQLKPIAILNTHHHNDHCGGNHEIVKKYPEISIYGSQYDYENKRIPFQTNIADENDEILIGEVKINVLETKGHTLGHLAYYNEKAIFVGDTLFSFGCGRLFEGSYLQMLNSIKKIIAHAKTDTKIYCGHEYTLSNLNFANSLNEVYFQKKLSEIKEKRTNNIPSVPFFIEDELKYNPFLMVFDEILKNEVLNYSNYNELEAFTELRKQKDFF